MTKTVVLIHGAWQVPASWARFRSRLEMVGYDVVAPSWPLMDRSVAALNAEPDLGLGTLGIGAIVEHYLGIVRGLPEAPLLVGHSFGGLIVQLLMDRGLGSAGVALNPAPIGGLIPGPTPLAVAAPILLRKKGWELPFVLSREAFDEHFANTVPQAQRDAEYEEFVVPAPGRIFYQAAFWRGNWVTPARRLKPLLITAGTEDRTVTPHLARQAYDRQRSSLARTDYHVFEGRSHYLANEPGWEQVVDYLLNWADGNR